MLFFALLLLAGGASRKPLSWGERIEVNSTGYCPCKICCGKHADGLTAINRDAYKAGVAVDPELIPLRSHLDIPGYTRGPNENGSWIYADDTGKDVKGYRVDVRFETHDEAVDWGRKTITVRVWPKGKKP